MPKFPTVALVSRTKHSGLSAYVWPVRL